MFIFTAFQTTSMIEVREFDSSFKLTEKQLLLNFPDLLLVLKARSYQLDIDLTTIHLSSAHSVTEVQPNNKGTR